MRQRPRPTWRWSLTPRSVRLFVVTLGAAAGFVVGPAVFGVLAEGVGRSVALLLVADRRRRAAGSAESSPPLASPSGGSAVTPSRDGRGGIARLSGV